MHVWDDGDNDDNLSATHLLKDLLHRAVLVAHAARHQVHAYCLVNYHATVLMLLLLLLLLLLIMIMMMHCWWFC